MKKNKRYINLFIILIITFLPYSISAQKIQINITYGNYTDDRVMHKFYSNERIWELKNNSLSYSIDANNLRYVDTLALTKTEIDSIIKCISEYNLTKSITKELNQDYLSKEGLSEDIIGTIDLNGKKAEIKIRSNGHHIIDEDPDGKNLDALEQLFYAIVGNHRK
ncbi:MAG: hypothetical protein HXX09_06385 [Bacteroidetes bacterium]|nr:hypothetical protein [Bacteroidota bacterium]